jgi:sugar phosphate isomerase/epimerase
MGTQLAEMFDAVDSPNVGALLDTANGYTVFCEPMDDARALAPYTMTTHLKNMKIVDFGEGGHIPMIAVGCDLGEGNIDIPEILRLIAEKSPHAEGLHLIIEPGWIPRDPNLTRDEQMVGFFERSLAYLKGLLEAPS